MIGRIRAKTGPRFFDPGVRETRRELDGSRKYFLDAPGGRSLVKADVLDGSTCKNPAVISRYKINVFRPEDALDFHILRAESNHLAFCGPHGRVGCDSVDRRGKGARGDDRPFRFYFFVL